MKQVLSVVQVQLHKFAPLNPLPAVAWLTTVGTVPTTGWTDVRLSPGFYVAVPADNIVEFDLIGDEPSGIVGDVVLPVSAATACVLPSWCVGVRVHAQTNSMQAAVVPAPPPRLNVPGPVHG